MEKVNCEATCSIFLPALADPTSELPHVNEIKKEFPLSEPHSFDDFQELAVVKHEDIGNQSLKIQIKSETSDVKFGNHSGQDDTFTKLEPLASEELHIKHEIEESHAEQTLKSAAEVERPIEKKSFKCSVCDFKCVHKGNLTKHMKTHTGERPFQCSVCDYKCIRSPDLRIHMKTHTGEKPFQCSICDYRCVQRGNLKSHLKTHTGDKPFQCSICDYRCVQRSNLKTHMKTHTGEKTFQCSICDYKCSIKCNLQKHMKLHTGEKPLQCSICDYRCIRKDDLQKHVKTHTGEKPLKCSVCDYRCIQRSALQKHLKTHKRINILSANESSRDVHKERF